jgi:hypothetical protein
MTHGSESRDLISRPLSFMLVWGVPILTMVTSSFIELPIPQASLVFMVSFVWMGIGCAVNAARCHRRHCYVTGPIFLLGALLTGLVGFGNIDLGQNGLSYTVWSTVIIAGVAYLSEKIWGRYAGRSHESRCHGTETWR